MLLVVRKATSDIGTLSLVANLPINIIYVHCLLGVGAQKDIATVDTNKNSLIASKVCFTLRRQGRFKQIALYPFK